MITAIPIPAFADNYIWLLRHDAHVLVVDPGDAAPVLDYCQQHQLTLDAILVTHQHADHCGGVCQLAQHAGCAVFGPQQAIAAGVDHTMADGMTITLEGWPAVAIWSLPGHTADHLGYLIDNMLFCGDTLFAGGCGRVFDGTIGQLFNSLQRISSLAEDTLIYCAHEYTIANLHFAQTVEPGNPHIGLRLAEAIQARSAGQATVPNRLADELASNPFLRYDHPSVRQSASRWQGRPLSTPLEVFTTLREWKNQFR